MLLECGESTAPWFTRLRFSGGLVRHVGWRILARHIFHAFSGIEAYAPNV